MLFMGKYRGIVSDNDDPLSLGRVRARVPDVYGDDESGWALPCLPFGGVGVGLFALPSVGAGIWIEFERGDPEYPIWTGCWWGKTADTPPSKMGQKPGPQKVVLRTEGGNYLLIDDAAGGGITLQTSDGKKFVMDSNGITLDNGQGATLKLSGSQITLNNGALEVT